MEDAIDKKTVSTETSGPLDNNKGYYVKSIFSTSLTMGLKLGKSVTQKIPR